MKKFLCLAILSAASALFAEGHVGPSAPPTNVRITAIASVNARFNLLTVSVQNAVKADNGQMVSEIDFANGDSVKANRCLNLVLFTETHQEWSVEFTNGVTSANEGGTYVMTDPEQCTLHSPFERR
jgi:hypothetical protein